MVDGEQRCGMQFIIPKSCTLGIIGLLYNKRDSMVLSSRNSYGEILLEFRYKHCYSMHTSLLRKSSLINTKLRGMTVS